MAIPATKTINIPAGSNLLDYLIAHNIATLEQIEQWKREAQAKSKSIIEIIEEAKEIKDDELLQAKSRVFNLPTIDLFGRVISVEVLKLIPEEIATNYKMICFSRTGSEISIGMVDPGDYKAIEASEYIARKNSFRIKYYVINLTAYKYVLRQYESLSNEVEEALKGTVAGDGEHSVDISEKGFDEIVRAAPVAKMVSSILAHAVEGKASDVHIEPVAEETRVRYRVDGILHTSLVLPRTIHPSIVARIKVLSNLKIDETRVPQDGRFRKKFESGDVDFRVSTLPVVENEKVVMRILDTSSNVLKLERLGFWGKNLERIKDSIKRPHGMFLITGPTGSGKSTTLYALLHILNKESVNIVTLEDPVEYYQKGINQSQVNPDVGLTFARGLRSILRQDPDIIMVGEIRDGETAELAVHASLTGHIVLSTLHTNDAFGAVPRLVDMDIEPFLLTSSLNLVMAQRLVRRLCDNCKEEIHIPKRYEDHVLNEVSKLDKQALPKGIKITKPVKFYKGKGCVRCANTGYKGRVAISEVLEVSEELKKIILSGSDLDAIKGEFQRQGMYYMVQDGFIKALQGLTTVEEVMKITKE
ncbi:GspE/PulE family protein [Patescibacteria group bacterium]|nr:GspE/PulE family protein [Patescibacteria group bacterium]MBU1890522.1 GspE/PulE family protein [Patescibacteria group bacterium]